MKTNTKVHYETPRTHAGAVAARLTPEKELSRTLACCLLGEDTFYESGESIKDRLASLVAKCDPNFVAQAAVEARTRMKLRHAPLLVVREMVRAGDEHRKLVRQTLPAVINRPDEIAEFMAMYWQTTKVTPEVNPKKGQNRFYHTPEKRTVEFKRTPVAACVRDGLRSAFQKFDAYSLAKYDRAGAVKLRDVAFMVHAKPKDKDQGEVFAKLVNKDFFPKETKASKFPVKSFYGLTGKPGLETPDTWEASLSKVGTKTQDADEKDTLKKAEWERLLAEGKLGGLAFLRNLRNMHKLGIEKDLIAEYAAKANVEMVLPFRYLAAARAVPQWEDVIEPLMLKAAEGRPKFKGKTVLLMDVSGSMDDPLSGNSDMKRYDAGAGVAILLREQCESIAVLTFSNQVVAVPARRGFALRDAMWDSQDNGGTRMAEAVAAVNRELKYDRLVVVTDEQAFQKPPAPTGKGYVININANKNGVGYGDWHHIDGWSEAVLDYMMEFEAL